MSRPTATATSVDAAAVASERAPVARGKTWAILINGGGSRQKNYQSHLLHVREMLELLYAAGVPKRRIDVFASDGSDPALDLAVRDIQPERNFWLIDGLQIGQRLRTEVRYEDSRLAGLSIRPASKHALAEWLDEKAKRIAPDDTLLIYVTDHGNKNSDDLTNNSIVLWGEDWSVDEYRRFIGKLDKKVRVVSLMSQCFSGSFANAIFAVKNPNRLRIGTCGYFASDASRPAYGCYPENFGKDNVGHSFRFFEALRKHGTLHEAHDAIQVTDRTPDVPNRTSDLVLKRELEHYAELQGKSFRTYVDEMLRYAWRDEIHYRSLFRQIDAIGEKFSTSTPRTLSALYASTRELPRLGRELRSHAHRWKAALVDLKRENLERFLDVHEFWREYLSDGFLDELEDDEKRELAVWLLTDLELFTRADETTALRLEALTQASEESAAAAYRMEVRRAAVRRMELQLVRISGLAHLDRFGTDAGRRGFESVADCEQVALAPPDELPGPRPQRRDAFPPLVDELALLETIRPGWLGIEFAAVRHSQRLELELEEGAVEISRVVADSPAATAGLQRGDIIVGPPGTPFRERTQIREWVMTSMRGQERRLNVLRAGVPITVTVKIGAAPI